MTHETSQDLPPGVKSVGPKAGGGTASVSDASLYSTAVSDTETKTKENRSSQSASRYEPQVGNEKMPVDSSDCTMSSRDKHHQHQITQQVAQPEEDLGRSQGVAGEQKGEGDATERALSNTAQSLPGPNPPRPSSSSIQNSKPVPQSDQSQKTTTTDPSSHTNRFRGGTRGDSMPKGPRRGTQDEDQKGSGRTVFNDSQGQFFTHKTKSAANSFFRKIWSRGKDEQNQETTQSAQAESTAAQEQPQAVSIEDLAVGDVVIAVMGPTGSGKSTLISAASGLGGQGVGHSLRSFTSEVKAVRFRDPESGLPVVLVDTPGFDDTSKPDTDILDMISDWLNSSYKHNKLLSGILYLHRITDNRMAGTPLKNLRVFQKLCGRDALSKVYLTTTMWDEVLQDVGRTREEELKEEYWRGMLRQGAQLVQWSNDGDGESAKKLIRLIVGQENEARKVQLQREMGDLRKELKETEAGQVLYSSLERMVEKQMTLLRRINAERKAASDSSELAELQREYDELRGQIDDKLRQMQQLKLPLTKRVFRFFGSLGSGSDDL